MSPGERVKQVREFISITQTEFGEKLGFKWYKVKNIEIGKQKLTADIALKIQEVFSVDYNWLLTGEGEMFPSKEAQEKAFYETLSDLEKKTIELMRSDPDFTKKIMEAAMELILKDKTGKK